MMSANEEQGSLGQARDRIAGLMDELESTLELVKRLSDTGDDEAALRLIDRQRSELYEVVNSLSHDVGAGSRSWVAGVRRNLTVVAAAVLAAVSTVAVMVGAWTNGPTDPVREARTQIIRTERIADPAERLTKIITIYRVVTEQAPDRSNEVIAETLDALQRTQDELEDDDQQDLADQADQAARDIQEGRPPTPPNPPSSDEGPVDTVRKLLPPG
jgi:hypothetical protein